MTYYVYMKPTGHGEVFEYEVADEFVLSEYTFLYRTEEKPDIDGKKWNGEEWVVVKATPDYVEARRAEYPKLADQMDMFWHAMNDGVIPKIEPFYSQIKEVKEKYPKPTQTS